MGRGSWNVTEEDGGLGGKSLGSLEAMFGLVVAVGRSGVFEATSVRNEWEIGRLRLRYRYKGRALVEIGVCFQIGAVKWYQYIYAIQMGTT